MIDPRLWLRVKANVFRLLMGIGMRLHRVAAPRPPDVDFTRMAPTTLSGIKDEIQLDFYVPKGNLNKSAGGLRPVIVNFHGGGFTLGCGTDDSRWADVVLNELGAVIVSVNYRLAPEHPFPTAVEDCADAILYLLQNSSGLGIDTGRMCLSGFSCGGNLTFSVSLKLQQLLGEQRMKPENSRASWASTLDSDWNLRAIVAWYPSVDYTRSRQVRRASALRQDKILSPALTDLFDAAYIDPSICDLSSPFLSPGIAPVDVLKTLPEEIMIYTCEWDELLSEGEDFAKRLQDEVGKQVYHRRIRGVSHGFDKNPSPWAPHDRIRSIYQEACTKLKVVLD